MTLFIEVIKHQNLILGDELQQTDIIFSDKPCHELLNSLLLELEHMQALLIFTVQNVQHHLFLFLSLEQLLHLQQHLHVFQCHFGKGNPVFYEFLGEEHKLLMD